MEFPAWRWQKGLPECPLLSALTLNMPKQSLISDSSCIMFSGRGHPTDSLTDPQLNSGLLFSRLFIACPLLFQALLVKQRKALSAAKPRTGMSLIGQFCLGYMAGFVRCVGHVLGNTLEYCPIMS